MKFFAFLVVVSAWSCVAFAPRTGPSRVLQLIVFVTLGALMTLAGGFAYWWDSGMRPSQKSAFVLICGVLTLASQAGTVIRAVLETEGGMPWPERTTRRQRRDPP